MIGHPVNIEIGEHIVDQTVVVDVESNGLQPAITVKIGVRSGGPHGGRPVGFTQAVLHT